MKVDLTDDEIQIIATVVFGTYVQRGGAYTINDKKVNTAIHLLVKLTDMDENELSLIHNETVKREIAAKERLEELDHPWRTFWRKLVAKFKK